MNDMNVREARTGETSLVCHFYFKLFEKQFDFLPNVEQYFLKAAADLFDDPESSRLWVIEQEGEIKGSICVVKKGETDGQLRLFGTDQSLQGKGAGKALMDKAMEFCRGKGYTHLYLWTIDICQAATHLYAKYGFHMTQTKPNTTWANYPMTEEKWEMDLPEKIDIVPAYEYVEEFKELVKEYTDDILQRGEEVADVLTYQHLSEELTDVLKKYGMPKGRMYVALVSGQVAGCIALAPNDEDYCEMKRLYVRPAYRGKHISRMLIETILADARAIGYKAMRLDTFSFMGSAIRVYEQCGFHKIERYNENPSQTVVFMQIDL